MGLVQGIVRRGGGDPDAAPPRPTIDDVARVLDVPAADVQRDGPVRSSDATLAYVAFVTRRVIDVAGALELAHSQGLLHRDIKPANILLSRASHAYLTDFGLMRDEDLDMTTMVGSEGGFAGTAAYASPEQLSGETARIGTWSDVYSLGATLYHTLALRLPYAGPGPMQILLQVARGQRVALHQAAPWVPTELASVVDQAMELDPRQRIATASEFAAELRVALSAALATRSGAVG
jgi:serine/threonine protein kinase